MTVQPMTSPRSSKAHAGRVLVVEDQPAVARAMLLLFDIHGIDAFAVTNADDALHAVGRGEADIVVQDMNFTPGATSGDEGTALFRKLRQISPGLPVILLTAWTSLETAVQLVKEGATDYLSKPWNDERLLTLVTSLLETRRGDRTPQQHGMICESAAMKRVTALALQVAGADLPVLITGPSGAGKEKIAELIQMNSRRKSKPFVKVNAGALPDQLLESELFGAEPGAFTGATRLRIGRFESANGGTLFLDEIGNLSPSGQAKLLRVLQNGEFERLGSSETRRADVRLLAATNADLRNSSFRQDLLFRLNVIEIHVPPLRERRDDIMPLALAFLATALRNTRSRAERFSDDARNALASHDWPGNVRELQNRIQRAVVMLSADVITAADLGFGVAQTLLSVSAEKSQLEQLLLESHGSVSTVAKALGISRQALYRKMERLGIILERRPRE
jgi:DNA-binding NtrC family response regulator